MVTYTARQYDVLTFIRATIEERGIAPTLEEIGMELGGISRVSVLDHLRALEKKGAIRRRPRESRAIEVLDPAIMPAKGIPIAGATDAAEPILEVEDREDVTLESYLRVGERSFLLRVQGDSMIGDHICDGDLVLVESATSARDGDTVVAVVDGEVTLKRFFKEQKGRMRLQHSNEGLRPKTYKSSAVRVRGIVRGVIRRT